MSDEEQEDATFEELQQIQEKIGVKRFAQLRSKRRAEEESSGSDASDFEDEKEDRGRKGAPAKRKERAPLQKNAPLEISSKKRPNAVIKVVPVVKKVHRDPRFDDLSGTFHPSQFQNSYAFLTERREKDKEELKKALRKTQNKEQRARLENTLKSMADRERAEKEEEAKRRIRAEHFKEERARLAEGKKPFFLKKSDEKKLALLQKYDEAKRAGRVDQIIGVRRKHTASKERRGLPDRRAHESS